MKPRGRGIKEAVEDYVSTHPVNAFTSRDIFVWIQEKRPEVAKNMTVAAVSMNLKRLFDKERIVMVRPPRRGSYGVYSRTGLRSMFEPNLSEDELDKIREEERRKADDDDT